MNKQKASLQKLYELCGDREDSMKATERSLRSSPRVFYPRRLGGEFSDCSFWEGWRMGKAHALCCLYYIERAYCSSLPSREQGTFSGEEGLLGPLEDDRSRHEHGVSIR